jgi:hypothetical protein
MVVALAPPSSPEIAAVRTRVFIDLVIKVLLWVGCASVFFDRTASQGCGFHLLGGPHKFLVLKIIFNLSTGKTHGWIGTIKMAGWNAQPEHSIQAAARYLGARRRQIPSGHVVVMWLATTSRRRFSAARKA